MKLRTLVSLTLVTISCAGFSDMPCGVLYHSQRPAAPNAYGPLVDLGDVTFNPQNTAGPSSGLSGKDGWECDGGSSYHFFGTKTVTAPALTFAGTFEDLQFWQVCDPPVSTTQQGTQVFFNAAHWYATNYTPGNGGNEGGG